MHARLLLTLSATAALVLTLSTAATDVAPAEGSSAQSARSAPVPERHALRMIRDGRRYFRFATFASEDFWGDVLGLHEAISGTALGGTGDGLSPQQALRSGLKVDVARLPADVREALQTQQLDLSDPAVTVELLRLKAVVGLTGFFDETGQLTSVGIQCALCHSTVDDSFAASIGHRRDGWANRDLDIGAIIALAPRLQPLADLLETDVGTVRKVLRSWGP